MTSPVLTFLGAAGTVTGSRFLIENDRLRVLVDAGLYQGLAELRRRNWDDFPVPADTIAAVVLTHAHLDHCGYLPKLVREGFTGRIVCTRETADLATIVLRDSAHLQEEDARHANERGYSKHKPALPLYVADDVEKTLPLFEPVGYGQPTELGPGLVVTPQSAGHILGSSTALIEVDGRRIQFSGDLGRHTHPLLAPPAAIPAVDVVVVESTYGDRSHPDPNPDVLAAAIRRTIARGGTVLIPAFAVDRTELVLIELQRLMRDGLIPEVPVFLDSPMALAALEVYQRSVSASWAERNPGSEPPTLLGGNVQAVTDALGSERLNSPRSPCIIVSASGMATGGRVVHHLQHQLPDRRNTVILTGYQAVGTRGRQLLDGAQHLKMYGRYLPVRAEIVDVPDFSVHADADEVIEWLRTCPVIPGTAYVVHGEPSSAAALAARIRADLGWCAVVPGLGERVRLD